MKKRFFVRFCTKFRHEWGNLYAVVIHDKIRKYLNTGIKVSKSNMSHFDSSGYFIEYTTEDEGFTEMSINAFMRALDAVMARLIASGQFQSTPGKELTKMVEEQRFLDAVHEFDGIDIN